MYKVNASNFIIIITIEDKDKHIESVFKQAGYIFPAGKKVDSTKRLSIDERLYIALGRIYNKDSGEDGMTRTELARLFNEHTPNITAVAKGDKALSLPINIFKVLFRETGLPYKDLEAPNPEHYQKDLPASLRKYKEENDI